MTQGSCVDVLVVGAGPIGLAMSCHLRRLGLSVRLIEKRSGPSVHSKAIGLQYRVSEILARLGIVDRFIAKGGSPSTVNLYAAGERLLQLHFVAPAHVSGRDAFAPIAILLPQSETEIILLDYLQELGGTIEWDTEFLSYYQGACGVAAKVQQLGFETEIAANWLVSCEGAHSIVRKQASIAFEGKTHPLAFFMADVPMEGTLPHTENHVWLHEDGSLAALPLPRPGTWRLFIEVTRQRHQLPHPITLADIHRLMKERVPNMDARICGEPLWLSDFRINCRMVDRMHDGRVFLAGDAAHIHSPTGGQGITTGMQDAANLAWKLARVAGGAPNALLDTYDEERLPHAAEVLRETHRTTSIFFAPNAALRVVRDALVLPVLRSAWVQRRMFGKLSQLHVHYRKSSLSRDHRAPWRRGRLRAGDRAPDVAFLDLDTGNRTTLFQLMAPLRPVVLFSGFPDACAFIERLGALDIEAFLVREASRPPNELSGLLDLYGDFARLYGLKSSFVCLVRPDGHVGLIVSPARLRELGNYLAQICDPQRVRRAVSARASDK
jgi:2-polyprenyl-6-methoxyphenol hydroxylase-like FAD-dependent oxidoreductase